MRQFHKLIFSVFVAILACQGLMAQKGAELFEAEMDTIMHDLNAVGIYAVCVKDNKIIYSKGFGVKNLVTNEKLDENSLFRIASISKSFTATAIMQLVEQGKLTLETDASDIVGFPIRNPKFPDIPITINMLLSHTSSLNDSQQDIDDFDAINPAKNPDWAKNYQDYKPGKGGYTYCGMNYSILGMCIEKLTGERFDNYIKHHILEPLKLYGSYCCDSLDRSKFVSLYSYMDGHYVERQEAYTHISVLDEYQIGVHTRRFSPGAGMKISIPDLARYMMMHMNYGQSPITGARIISEESSKNMQSDHSYGRKVGYGLQASSFYTPGVWLEGHTGGAYGLSSAMFFDPQRKFGFTLACSGATPSKAGRGSVLKQVMQALYRAFIAE